MRTETKATDHPGTSPLGWRVRFRKIRWCEGDLVPEARLGSGDRAPVASLWIGHRDLAVLAQEVLRHGQVLWFQAHGFSMQPFIQPGDRLRLRPLRPSGPVLGEVILYRTSGERLAAHRVVGRAPGAGQPLRVRGDRLWAPLEAVEPSRLLGRVDRLERGSRLRRLERARYRLPVLLWIGLRPGVRLLHPWLGRIRRRLCAGLQTLHPVAGCHPARSRLLSERR